MQTISAIALSLLTVACGSASSAHRDTYSFGRTGGNIRPYTVVISPTGAITSRGAVLGHPGKKLTGGQLKTLARLVQTIGFFSQPRQIRCPGTLPDVAAAFIEVTTPAKERRVLVHGACDHRFERLYLALSRAAGVQ